MRTTVRLQDGLLRRAKKYAAEHELTLTYLLDQGLRKVLDEKIPGHNQTSKRKTFKLTVFGRGGLLPGIDPTSNAQMLDIADGLDVPR